MHALVLLAGAPKPSPLLSGAQRCVVDLPFDERRDLLALWLEQCRTLFNGCDEQPLQLRLLANANVPSPRPRSDEEMADLAPFAIRIEQETTAYRGSGGALRDAVAAHDDDDRILVATAGQLLLHPLNELVALLCAEAADITVFSHRDGTPGGLFYLRCGCLRDLPDRGFIDFKEQALPRLARRHTVRVVETAGPSALPVRTQRDYLTALRWFHGHGGAAALRDPFAEDCHRTFAIVEPNATVASDTHIHDAVVLAGARVESGATVVRCVVGPGARVPRGARVVDEIITGPSQARERQ